MPDGFSPHEHAEVRTRVAGRDVGLVLPPAHGSWLNRIASGSAAPRRSAPDGTGHRAHDERNAAGAACVRRGNGRAGPRTRFAPGSPSGVEREVLPVAQRHGVGTLASGPLGRRLTGRVRTGERNELRRAGFFQHLNDGHRLDAVERFVPLAEEAGLPLTRLARASATAHPGVTSALVGRAR
ncbi:hypothetical protein [Streptomyces glaucus]|uniref:Uncharacterized protein n=1 Tax=Streptomyces glaucus TaxID=284029 RepID=A0ABP5X3N8_9ACTN